MLVSHQFAIRNQATATMEIHFKEYLFGRMCSYCKKKMNGD